MENTQNNMSDNNKDMEKENVSNQVDTNNTSERRSAEESPKTEAVSPKAEARSPKAEEESPKPEEESPKPEEESPKAEEESPKPEEESPKAEGKSPKPEEESPKAEEESPKAEEESPKAEEESPKPEEESPKPEEESPKPEEESPRAEKESPKAEEESPKPEEESSKAGEESSKAEEESSKEAEAKPASLPSHDDLETEDDTREIESDEDHEEEHPDEMEMPDYASFSSEDLISSAEKLVKEQPIQKIKEHIEGIRKYLLKHLNEERSGKLAEFIEAGGVEMDFEFIQPLREKFRPIFQEYRAKRKAHYDELSAKLDANLFTKTNLIEKLKEIVTKEESIGDTFKEFNHIQEEWRSTGPVPRNKSNDLWRTYHFHVENFYEFININKELRDLDYKKNKEAKQNLILQAKEILSLNNLKDAFGKLQKLHKEWRRTGPVEPDSREPLWEEFSDVTKKFHEKREEYYQKSREKSKVLLVDKRLLVEKIKAIPHNFTRHHEWQNAIKDMGEIQDQFKKIGRLNIPENDEVWEELKGSLRDFNHAKNEFYKDLKKDHQDNLNKKRALLEKAEALKDNEDWRETANELKRIQADWKIIGHVPKSESDKIWKSFRKACNHFFDRMTEKNKEADKAFEANKGLKEAILAEVEAFTLDPKNKKEALSSIKVFINRWKEVGPVPRNQRNKVDGKFNKIIDSLFKSIDMDREESQRIRFENKMDNLADEGGIDKLNSERDFLKRKLEEAQSELRQLETNMSFFSSSDPNSSIVKEAQKSIDTAARAVDSLKKQLSMLTAKVKEIVKAEEVFEEEALAAKAEAEAEAESPNKEDEKPNEA